MPYMVLVRCLASYCSSHIVSITGPVIFLVGVIRSLCILRDHDYMPSQLLWMSLCVTRGANNMQRSYMTKRKCFYLRHAPRAHANMRGQSYF